MGVYSWRVNDVAIALAYVMVCLCNPDNKRAGFVGGTTIRETALMAAAYFAHGFLSQYELQPAERAMVWRLAACRLATSATMGWYSWSLDPANEYLKYHATPAWE